MATNPLRWKGFSKWTEGGMREKRKKKNNYKWYRWFLVPIFLMWMKTTKELRRKIKQLPSSLSLLFYFLPISHLRHGVFVCVGYHRCLLAFLCLCLFLCLFLLFSFCVKDRTLNNTVPFHFLQACTLSIVSQACKRQVIFYRFILSSNEFKNKQKTSSSPFSFHHLVVLLYFPCVVFLVDLHCFRCVQRYKLFLLFFNFI